MNKTEILDSRRFGLTARDRIERIDAGHIAFVLDRKSRILMADGHRILIKAEAIRERAPGVRISVKTNAPVCGKTRIYLLEREIAIRNID